MASDYTDENGEIDYPVQINEHHRVSETADYSPGDDRFDCSRHDAWMHTGAWPTWSFCPFCGGEL